MRLVQDGLAFYQKVKHIVRDGDIRLIDCNVEYYREPVGRQIYVKDFGDERLIIIHRLIADAKIEIEMEGYRLVDCYTDLRYEVRDGMLLIDDVTDYKAGAFLLKK